ncbi:MAG: alpha/beta hydrolase [Alphaproteobacteria bacterium]|nr:alpha/beta hydrolase [Alphaproteobacteria bacterium]
MGRTMLLVHGAFAGAWAWQPFRAHFEAAGWRCIAPDLRHHHPGADLDALGQTGIEDYASDLAALIATLDAPPVLVGHSMGALLCQKLAARGLGRALILLAPAPGWGILPSSGLEVLSRFALLQSGADFWRKAVPPRFDYAAGFALDRFPPPRQRELYGCFLPESGRALAEMLYWMFDPRQASAVEAHRIRQPTLCLVGRGDRVTPPDTVRAIARRLAGPVAHEEIDGHSHFLLGEPGFEMILQRLQSWLDRLPGLG